MKFRSGDIDLDFGDRSQILDHIKHTAAAMRKADPIRKHATGVYVTPIPYDPMMDMASIDYTDADDRGYFKLDLLNVHIYNQVRDEEHLKYLMREPNWSMLESANQVSQLIHLGNHFTSIQKMPEPINSIPRLAMFLAVIRPGKKHLIGKRWGEIAKSVWDKEADGDYTFKKAHSLAYAHLVVVHMNLLNPSV